ncbi:hypothetical protein [Leptospira noguchii]|uniref:hypothetical protein n=1 Tax=Leptospira noguchii TaxID=28182 RepID=UPI000AAFF863|nr:hypothetical protein [Leptospira noguchii]UOG48013.1 hypothetical protein MAL00_13325 [Leptospira noguchii]
MNRILESKLNSVKRSPELTSRFYGRSTGRVQTQQNTPYGSCFKSKYNKKKK